MTANAQELSSISPFFVVRSVPHAVEFYEKDLGFELRYAEPNVDPFFAIVGRDTVQILLKEIAAGVEPKPNPSLHEWAPWDAFILVGDPDALATELEARTVQFHRPMSDRDDGLRGFEVRDNDGYVLFFGRPSKQV